MHPGDLSLRQRPDRQGTQPPRQCLHTREDRIVFLGQAQGHGHRMNGITPIPQRLGHTGHPVPEQDTQPETSGPPLRQPAAVWGGMIHAGEAEPIPPTATGRVHQRHVVWRIDRGNEGCHLLDSSVMRSARQERSHRVLQTMPHRQADGHK